MMIPQTLHLHLLSSLDAAGNEAADRAGIGEGTRLLVIETARRAEGRVFAKGEPLPFEDRAAEITLCDLSEEDEVTTYALIEGADALVILGGNTFALMAALERTGFAAAVSDRALREETPFHVIGESAGAVVMGRSISHVASMDDPSLAPEGTHHGLGWLGIRVLPHRGEAKWGYGEKVEALIAANTNPHDLLVIEEDGIRSFPEGLETETSSAHW